MRDIDCKVLALRRLSMCRRLGRLPRSLYAREPSAIRWVAKLRAFDAVSAGATQREIATALVGERRTATEWSGRSDYLRLRVQRLVRDGRRLSRGGYRALLS
ncbi:DNA -binding domain-containing protein [Nitrospirillum amazonense]